MLHEKNFEVSTPESPTCLFFNESSVIDLIKVCQRLEKQVTSSELGDKTVIFFGGTQKRHVPVITKINLQRSIEYTVKQPNFDLLMTRIFAETLWKKSLQIQFGHCFSFWTLTERMIHETIETDTFPQKQVAATQSI